jgi:predicted secreted hydrolase
MYRLSKEYRRKDISGDREKLDLSIGPNRVRHLGNVYQLDINEKELKLSLTLRGDLPGFQFGNGQVFFYENRSAVWGIGFNAPRAAVSGRLTVAGRSFKLAGYGYHDHSWSTIKVPTFAKQWYTLRLYAQDISIILHQIYLTEKFGGGLLFLGIFGNNGATGNARFQL